MPEITISYEMQLGSNSFLTIPSTSIAPAILRQASYGTMKIGLYHFFKKKISITLQRRFVKSAS